MLDSAWDVACIRAQRAGKLLATMLAGRAHGDRPVTLIGLSVGALVAFHCLLELRYLGAGTLQRYLLMHISVFATTLVAACHARFEL